MIHRLVRWGRGHRGAAPALATALVLAGGGACEHRATVAPATSGPSPIVESIAPSAAALALTVLPPEFMPSSSLRSLGSEIVWTQAPSSTADIWRLVPGHAPGRVFENPRRDSLVTQVARNGAAYAFVEANDLAYGDGGWRVWYLPIGASAPIEVARGNSPAAGVPPSIALDDRRLVWAGYDEPADEYFSFLRVAAVNDLANVETILRLPIEDALFRTPVLDGDDLWYVAVDADFQLTGVGDESHVEWIDLGSSARSRERFAGTADDADADVTPSTVIWKTVAHGIAYLSWGDLHALDRATNHEVQIPVAHINRPSIGDRFVTFEEITKSRLLLWDTRTDALIDASAALPPGTAIVTSESVAGSLLVLAIAEDADASPRIAWVQLPN